MDAANQSRFDEHYRKHLTALKLQGKANKTIEAYALSLRRLAAFVDRCPDDLTVEDLTRYFLLLLKTRSWSLIKIERHGLGF